MRWFPRWPRRQGLPTLLRQMQGQPGAASPLALASRMWVDTAATVPGTYTQRLSSRWQADALRLPFSQSEAARAQINNWTLKRTAGRIKDLLPAGSITSATKLALTSAVHFRSPWEKPFDAAKTAPRAFKTAAGESKLVPTMVDERGGEAVAAAAATVASAEPRGPPCGAGTPRPKGSCRHTRAVHRLACRPPVRSPSTIAARVARAARRQGRAGKRGRLGHLQVVRLRRCPR